MTTHNHDINLDGAGQVGRSALQFDPAKYAAELDTFDITDAQKQELLLTLWSIMRSFVELGFTVDVCGALLGDTLAVIADGDVR